MAGHPPTLALPHEGGGKHGDDNNHRDSLPLDGGGPGWGWETRCYPCRVRWRWWVGTIAVIANAFIDGSSVSIA